MIRRVDIGRREEKERRVSQTLDYEMRIDIDPGCLPAWGVGELPRPRPLALRNWRTWIGPGLVLAGASLGMEEFLLGPQLGARHGGMLLWIVLISLLCQAVLHTEAMRYTLLTGEPVLVGFMRSWPGPRFWGVVYLVLDFGGWWPTQAALAANILVALLRGLAPAEAIDPDLARHVACGVLAMCGIAALLGRKTYDMLMVVSVGKLMATLLYMAFCAIFFVSAPVWMRLWGALVNPFNLPHHPRTGEMAIDWALLAAMAGLAGLGGMNNIMVSHFLRDAGWGMGAQAGAIPSAFSARDVRLLHVGTAARMDEPTIFRFKAWWKHILADQCIVWVIGSILAVMLPLMLGAQYLNGSQRLPDGAWRWAVAMGQDFGAAQGRIFRHLTLLAALVVLIPGQYIAMENIARRWTDVIWSASRRARSMKPTNVRHIFYALVFICIGAGVLAYTFFPRLDGTEIMIVAANMANLAIAVCIVHTLYVNHRFLPRPLRPSAAKSALLAMAGLFFLLMFALALNQKVIPLLRSPF